MTATGIGASVRRKEDQRFITGKGHYTDDINRPGQAHAYFLRSPHAHADDQSRSTRRAARRCRASSRVFTGDDLAADKIGGLICGWMIHSKDGSPMKAGPHPALAQGKVRYVGDHVAVVIAETLAQAQRRGRGDRRRLRRAAGGRRHRRRRRQGAAPQVHDVAPDNTVFDWHLGDKAATDAAFAHGQARHQARPRQQPARAERRWSRAPRSATTTPATDGFTLYTTSQNPHVARLVLSAFIGIAPEHKLRVIAPDVGGGFGSKIFIYAEETVCVWAAKKVGRPVKWTADRTEAFLCRRAWPRPRHPCRAGDRRRAARSSALRVQTIANLGAYLSTFASSVPTYLYAPLLSGQYDIPAIYCEVDAVYTNTAPVDAYRGAGRPEATFVVERLVEVAARELGMDPAKFRRQQLHQEASRTRRRSS